MRAKPSLRTRIQEEEQPLQRLALASRERGDVVKRAKVILMAGILVLVIGFILTWWFNGAGFSGYDKVTKEYTPTGQLTKITKESQPGKTVWDWLNLLGVLAIPVVVGFGAAWFTRTQQLRDQQLADERSVIEREVTRDTQQEATLQAYIDNISELLLKERLSDRTADGKLNPEYDPVRVIARVRTITVLSQLNVRRIGVVFAFLREAGLTTTTSASSVVNLAGAELRAVKWKQANLFEADLSGVNFFEADLSGADLSGADLSEAYLRRADLSGADLSGANLRGANLSEANLSGADLRKTDLNYANLFKAKVSGAKFDGAVGLTDEQLANYQPRDAVVVSIPQSRSPISPPPFLVQQQPDGEKAQSPAPKQLSEPLLSSSDTTLPIQKESGVDTNNSSAAPPTEPNPLS